eukprot:jgi/Undpi1/1599/HiC_scaffold_11.g04989.m1
MGELCDRLLCEKILLYKTTGRSVVAAHLNACVTGHCPECEQKQRRFLDCPRHHESRLDAPDNPDNPQEQEVKWEAFVQVDDNGKEIRPYRRGEQLSTARRQGTNDGGDNGRRKARASNQLLGSVMTKIRDVLSKVQVKMSNNTIPNIEAEVWKENWQGCTTANKAMATTATLCILSRVTSVSTAGFKRGIPFFHCLCLRPTVDDPTKQDCYLQTCEGGV